MGREGVGVDARGAAASTGIVPTDWAPSTATSAPAARAARAAPATSRSAPVDHETCDRATRRVRGPASAATAPSRSPSAASAGITRSRAPARRAITPSGTVRPGCSIAVVMISSPGRQSMPQAARFMPSVVLALSATPSGPAPTSRPAAARTAAAAAAMRPKPSRLPRARSGASAAQAPSARAAGSASGPIAPVFR